MSQHDAFWLLVVCVSLVSGLVVRLGQVHPKAAPRGWRW